MTGMDGIERFSASVRCDRCDHYGRSGHNGGDKQAAHKPPAVCSKPVGGTPRVAQAHRPQEADSRRGQGSRQAREPQTRAMAGQW